MTVPGMLDNRAAVASSLVLVQSAMSPAPTSVTVTVCPKTGAAISPAVTHEKATNAAYLAKRLCLSAVPNTFKDAITLSPYTAHGLGFVARHYLLTLVNCLMSLDEYPFPTLPTECS